MYRGTIAMVAGLLLSSAASATTLQPMQGDVLVNRGAGFQPVVKPTTVGVGDSIMVSAKGSAQVVYNEQCSVDVRPGSVVTVALEPPCKKSAAFDPDAARMNLGACSGKSFCEPPREEHRWLHAVPIGVIAVTAGLCIAEEGICDDKGASPD